MQADWSVECGAGDPLVVLPWASEDRSLRFIDLRASPESIQQIPEAQQYACVAAALRRWNSRGGPIFTAKCDVWSYPADLFDAEDLDGFAFAQGSYVDLISTDPERFRSFAASEKQLRAWTASARAIELQQCRCEWTLRAARIFPTGTQHPSGPELTGFATSLYVWGYGGSPQAAASMWAEAIESLIEPALLLSGS